MSRLLQIIPLVLVVISCKVTNQPAIPTTQPSTSADIETTDTIVLDFDPTDPLVTPGMPLVACWPSQYESLSGHFVIFIDSLSPRVAQLTLLSLRDWSGIFSANSTSPTQAADTASLYSEYGLAEWSIPTETLASRMKSDLDIEILNAHLTHLHSLDIDSRYLCEYATKTFSFAPNTKVASAGAKTKYHLRLIRTLRIARK